MHLLKRTPTRHYFISVFFIASALFLTFSAVIYRHYVDARRLSELALYNYEVIRRSRSIIIDLIDMETGVRGYMLSGRRIFLEPYNSSQFTLPHTIESLRKLTEDNPDSQEQIELWLKKIEDFSALLKQQVHVQATRGIGGFTQDMLDTQKHEMDDLRQLVENYIRTRIDNLQTQIDASRNKERDFVYILGIGTVLAVGGMLLVTLVITLLLKRTEQSEGQARALEERFQAVMNGVNDGLYDFNVLDGTIYYSSAYKTMLGYTDEEFPNTVETSTNIIHPEDLARSQEILQSYIKGETTVYKNTFRMQHKDARWIWILSRGVALKDATGQVTNLIGTHTDITEQKKREEELEQLTAEMETFTYITSHDLRAPLVNLRGFASEMQHALQKTLPIIHKTMPLMQNEEQAILKQTFDEEIPESLRFIEQSVEKMDSLTTAVLDLSRIGKREYRTEMVNVDALVQRCVDTLAYEISKKNIEVILDPLPPIDSDPLALEQIFSNILDNAIKYLDPARRGKITITARQMVNEIIYSVEDNGRGIVEADKSKVFQIFRRARNTLDVRGIGMGMTYVQATLRRLGGLIWFTSTAEVGTTFSFSLPRHSAVKGTQA